MPEYFIRSSLVEPVLLTYSVIAFSNGLHKQKIAIFSPSSKSILSHLRMANISLLKVTFSLPRIRILPLGASNSLLTIQLISLFPNPSSSVSINAASSIGPKTSLISETGM